MLIVPASTMFPAARIPSGSSPAPATTNVGGCAVAQGWVYEKPYSDGSLGGYGGGIERKKKLLASEGVEPDAPTLL